MIKYGIVLFMFAYSVQSELVRDKQRCVCTREYNPVCGSDGKTYSSPCVFDCINKDKDVDRTPGKCEEKNESPNSNFCPCPLVYSPVCGTDGKTYSNKCNLNCAKSVKLHLEIKHDGKCREENGQPKFCACTLDYNPVCGTDEKTYPNKCSLECEGENSKGLAIKHEGSCPEKLCACARHYRPICANDGETYSNECTFKCKQDQTPGLESLYEGECNSVRAKRDAPAACVCTFIYQPVCGDDGKTYGNPCAMECSAKESGRSIAAAHAGPCRTY